MSDSIIRVENLSKKYIIGHQKQGGYVSLRDEIANGTKSMWNRLIHPNQKQPDPYHEEFWVLKDVNFEIKQGDRVTRFVLEYYSVIYRLGKNQDLIALNRLKIS